MLSGPVLYGQRAILGVCLVSLLLLWCLLVARFEGVAHFAGLERKRRSSWGMKSGIDEGGNGLRAARA